MNNFLKLNNIDKSNTYVIGDIHGCYYSLIDLIEKLPINANIIFTGDLIDKGLNSLKVVEFIKNNNYLCVLGNHEEFLLNNIYDVINNKLKTTWNTNEKYGGQKTIECYKYEEKTLKQHYKWIKELPLFIEIDNLIISHAFVLPYYNRRFEEKYRLAILNNRINSEHKKFWEENFEDYNVINIFGHDRNKDVIQGKNYFGIDTGLVYGNKLTAMKLSDFSITQIIINKKDYQNEIKCYL